MLSTSSVNGTPTDMVYFDTSTETVISGSTTTTPKDDSVNGQRLAEKVGSSLSSLITDLPGSVVMAVTSVGTVTVVELSDPYGQMNYSWGTMPTAHNYTGQRLESQSGLLYDGFRWYDPLAGIFVRADTKQTNAQGFNPYASVNDNPETKNDPSGHRYVPNLGGNGTPPPAPGPDAIYQWCLQDAQCNQTEADYSDEIFSQQLQDAQGWLLLGFELAPSIGEALAGDPEGLEGDVQQFEELTGENPEQQVLSEACSFTPTTVVETAKGEQAIGKVQVGEKVLAYNRKTRKMELQPVLHVWIHQDNDLVDLTITTPVQSSKEHKKQQSTQAEEVIHTNKKHPFFTLEKGFLPVGQIKVGMHVVRADGRIGVVMKWQPVPGVQTMYNLEVAQDHTFTVGSGEWIVHNCTPSAFDAAMRTAYRSDSPHDVFAAQAGLALQKVGVPILKFLTKLNSDGSFPGDGSGGDTDLETPNMIVEVKSGISMTGQIAQLEQEQTNPIRNPEGKPIVVYAPSITNTNAINNILAHGAYFASNPSQLIAIEYYLQAGRPLG